MSSSSGGGLDAMKSNCSVSGSESNLISLDGFECGGGNESGGERGGPWQESRNLRKKRKGGSKSDEDSERQDKECFKCVVRFGEATGGVSRINPMKLTKSLSDSVGRIEFAKVLQDGNLLVGCANVEQVAKAVGLNSVCGIKVVSANKVGDNRANRGRKGVIAKVPVDVGVGDIKRNLKGGIILDVYRIKSWVDGVRQDTETVVLEFQGSLPSRVILGVMSYPVREFVPRPVRCFKCQKFGHVALSCKQSVRCARCSGEHEYGKCETGVQPKCCNCGEAHSAAYRGCHVLKQEVEIQKVRVEKKLSYVDAAKQVRGQPRLPVAPSVTVNAVSKEDLVVEKKKLVSFVVHVINGTAGVQSKTQKCKIIVKAAAHHLGLPGMRWEEVMDELHALDLHAS